jgi:hypothetical protein
MMGNHPEFFNRFMCDTSGQFSLFIAPIPEGSGSFVLFLLLILEQFRSCAHNHHHHHRYYDRGRPLDPQNLLDSALQYCYLS